MYKTPYLTRFFDTQGRRWFITLLWTALFLQRLLDPDAPFIPPSADVWYQMVRDAFYASVHVVGFGLTTLLWWWALAWRTVWQVALLKSVGFWLIMAFITEWWQSFTPGRYAQAIDLLADIAGITIAVLGVWVENGQVKDKS